MPSGCSAGYCTNTNKKGYQMSRFPKDLKRRKMWIQNMNRTDWILTSDARLCDVHFAPQMWITRNDGSRRLKPDAVPTIFGENLQTFVRQNIKVTEAAESEANLSKHATEAAETESDVSKDALNKMEEINSEEDVAEEKNYIFNIPSNGKETSDPSVVQRLKRLEILYAKSERFRLRMKKKLRLAKRSIKMLETEVHKNSTSSNISNIFNKDQLCLLSKSYKRIPKWCNGTLIRAYKLKIACGTAGYQELLKANFPLPSIRTLSRKLKSNEMNKMKIEIE